MTFLSQGDKVNIVACRAVFRYVGRVLLVPYLLNLPIFGLYLANYFASGVKCLIRCGQMTKKLQSFSWLFPCKQTDVSDGIVFASHKEKVKRWKLGKQWTLISCAWLVLQWLQHYSLPANGISEYNLCNKLDSLFSVILSSSFAELDFKSLFNQ